MIQSYTYLVDCVVHAIVPSARLVSASMLLGNVEAAILWRRHFVHIV